MVRRIQGISVEISGDTTPLEKALSNVNAESRKTASELRQIDKALNFDPGNINLITQQQEVLQKQIQNTSQRLDVLRQAQQDVQRQFESGQIDAAQYRKFQRDIEVTENQLRQFQDRLEKNVQLKVDSSQLGRLKTELRNVGQEAANVGREISNGISTGAAAATAGIAGLVLGTQELNGDLARLRTNADIAGVGLEEAEAAFQRLYQVSGEADSSVEAVSNLLAAGFQGETLSAALDNISGAAIRFSDTLNIEGIADGLQETLASGAAIGQFAELLERSGVDVDAFNEGLAGITGEAARTQFAIDTLNKLGLSETTARFAELNPEVAANQAAMANLQLALSDLSIVLTPLITFVSNLLTRFVEWASANPQLVTTVALLSAGITALTGVFAILSPIVTALISLWPVLTAAIGAISAPIAIAVVAIGSIVAALTAAFASSESFREGVFSVFGAVRDFVVDVFSNIADFVSERIGFIKDFWDSNGKQIQTAFENVFNAIRTVVEFVFPAIQAIVEGVIGAISNVIDGGLNFILGIVQTFGAVFSGNWSGVWDGVQRILSGALETVYGLLQLSFAGRFIKIIGKFADDAVSALKTFGGKLKSSFDDVLKKVTDTFNGYKTKFTQFGKDIIDGLKNGIVNAAKNVYGAIKNVADTVISTAKNAFRIKSPSRVFREFGEFIGIGLADGIDSTERLNERVMENLSNTIIDIQSSANKEIQKLNDELYVDIVNTQQDAENKIAKIQNDAAKKKRKLTSDEVNQIEKIRRDSNNKVLDLETKFFKAKDKLLNDEKKSVDAAYKDLLDNAKSFVDNQKSLNSISLVEEANFWKGIVELFQEGTDQRIKAQQEYAKVVEGIQKQVTDTNKKFSDEFNRIFENQTKEEERLNKAYSDAVNNRANTLQSFTGLFDKFESDNKVTGESLLENLTSQVIGFRNWQRELDEISAKGVSGELLDELRELGPNSLPELVALNQLTSEQLQQYSDLFGQRNNLARQQAEDELIGLRNDTASQIDQLKATTKQQLSELERDWVAEIKSITGETANELKSLEQIGVEAGKGLRDGLASTIPEIDLVGKLIGDKVSTAIKDALQVRSPSRITMGIGMDVGEGLALGMEDTINRIKQSSLNLAQAALSANASLSASSTRMTAGQVSNQTIINNQQANNETLLGAIAQLLNKPNETVIMLDGRVIANNTSQVQYSNANLSAVMKGVVLE